MKRPLYEKELEPPEPSSLTEVYEYLDHKINYTLRHSVEYPSFLPSSRQKRLFYTIAMLSSATEYYDAQAWEKLDQTLDRLINQREKNNFELNYKIAENTENMIIAEENGVEFNDEQQEATSVKMDIQKLYKRQLHLKNEIRWLERMQSKLVTDPRINRIEDLKEEIAQITDNFNLEKEEHDVKLKRLQQSNEIFANQVLYMENKLNTLEERLESKRQFAEAYAYNNMLLIE